MSPLSLEPLHRFHSYCARFPSEVVEAALERYTKPGDSIFDPFCGSGTTLVASLAHGRRVIGTDIDTLAGMLSEVKCVPFTAEQYAKWRKDFVAKLTKAFEEIARAWGSHSQGTRRTDETVRGRLTGHALPKDATHCAGGRSRLSFPDVGWPTAV